MTRVTQTVTGYLFRIWHGLHNLWHGLLFQKLPRVTQTGTGYFFRIFHGLHILCHGLLFTKFSTIEMQAPRGSFCLHEEFMFLFKVLFRAERVCPRVARVYNPLGRSVVKKSYLTDVVYETLKIICHTGICHSQ